jgi:site-specific recombinase XerD
LTALAPTLQAFFTDRLTTQRRASGCTIAAYRDTWRMLLGWASKRAGQPPSRLDIADLDAPEVSAFLDHLEKDRGNSIRTRNARLAAIHSAFSYAALRHPEHAALIARVLAIPAKRADKAIVTWLTEEETTALLAAPDLATRTGRRDHAMLHLAIVTGLRVSELTALTRGDLCLATGPHVTCHGKGRKQRATPLTAPAVAVLRAWLAELPAGPGQILFPGRTGNRLSRDAIESRLATYATTAAARCPSLAGKKTTPHVLRHTAAMRLLHAGVEISVIALWLGHEQTETAQIYLHADLTIKEQALARTTPPGARPGRYRPPDPLLAFLESL